MLNNVKLLTEYFEKVKEDIIQEQRSQKRVASGKSIDAYQVEVDFYNATLYGISYVGTLETGRKGGKVPYGFADIILQWMQDKNIFLTGSESKDKSIAFLIARNIKEKGTKLHRDGGNSGVLSGPVNQKSLDEFTNKLLDEFQNDTIEQILFQFAA